MTTNKENLIGKENIICPHCNGSGNLRIKTRREILEHSGDCPMRFDIFRNCICHLDDCLDYKGIKHSSHCICPQLNAKEKGARELIKWLKLPLYKRIFIKKPKWSHYYQEFLPKQI